MIRLLTERNVHMAIVYEESYSRLTYFVKMVENVSIYIPNNYTSYLTFGPSTALQPISRYAQADGFCSRTKIRRNLA